MGRLSAGGVLHAGGSDRGLMASKPRRHRGSPPVCVCVCDQSDREKTEGLPVAPFMDREKVTKPTAQIGFIKFVLIPMFETVMKVSAEGQGVKACAQQLLTPVCVCVAAVSTDRGGHGSAAQRVQRSLRRTEADRRRHERGLHVDVAVRPL